MPIRLVRADLPGPGPVAAWHEEGPRVLGRAADCDVVLAARGVSKRHAAIERRGDAWSVRDLGSSNGTLLNHRRLTGPASLGDGDELTLGVCILRVHIDARAEPPAGGSFVVREAGGERALPGPRLVIGRRADCQVVIVARGISRRHCTIERTAQGFVLRDLDSRNGTFLGPERVVHRLLQDGDRIAFGDPEATVGRITVLVALAGTACTLQIDGPAAETTGFGGGAVSRGFAAALALGEEREAADLIPEASARPAPAPEAAPAVAASGAQRAVPAEVAPVSAAARREEAIRDSDELSRVIPTLARHKAKYRGEKWVPTSDLSPHRARHLACAAAVAGTFLTGAAMLATETVRPDPGPLAAVHRGARFIAEQRGANETCRPCHQPFRGVTNAACERCHPARTIAPPHDPPTLVSAGHEPLRCAACHLEHEGDPASLRAAPRSPEALAELPHPPPALPVERGACLRCHAGAHRRPAINRDTPGMVFLNVFYSSTWVHTLHLAKPPCASCHQTEKDRETGKVTTSCQVCHGGTMDAASDGRCLSCHYLHRPGPLLPQGDPGRSGAKGARAAGDVEIQR